MVGLTRPLSHLLRIKPSLEIFAFHPQLRKWVEVGNSGMFRPEMLEPMGFPKDVHVHGWGIGLERPTMIRCVTSHFPISRVILTPPQVRNHEHQVPGRTQGIN